MRTTRNLFTFLLICVITQSAFAQNTIELDDNLDFFVAGIDGFDPQPGDIIEVDALRKKSIKILDMEGTAEKPITIINSGGQVNINESTWAAIELKNCKHIIISGSGDPNYRYGFKLEGKEAGIGITEYSSDVTVEFVEIGGTYTPENDLPEGSNGWSFFGIVAKKDFGGTPTTPYPQFNNLVIHDTYIHDVHEGMYLGETKSPGMEFRSMRLYNNVVKNTYKEAIQIANSVSDIEIHNNFLYNSGLAGDYSHTNLLQIGDNSQGKVYNNVLIECPTYGVIVLGTGQIEISNNYLHNTRGIFCDNRNMIFPLAEMRIFDNFFNYTKTGDNDFQVIKYYNEEMDLYVYDNAYYDPEDGYYDPGNEDYDLGDEYFKYGFINSIVGPPALDENNIAQSINPIEYTCPEGVYVLNEHGPAEYIGYGPNPFTVPTPFLTPRIILDQTMVEDETNHPSLRNAHFLVDEQNMNPFQGEHPVSSPWIPGRNIKGTPFHTIITLDHMYYLTDLYVHDAKQNGEIVFSYRDGKGDWIDFGSDQCLNRNVWNQHKINTTTNSIRISMYSSVKGQINEIALYGYISSISSEKSGKFESQTASAIFPTKQKLTIYPNPASDWVTIQTSFDRVSTEILDTNGRKILTTEKKQINLSELANGLYFVRSQNMDSGEMLTNRLIINH